MKPVGVTKHKEFDFWDPNRKRADHEWRRTWESEYAFNDPCCQVCAFGCLFVYTDCSDDEGGEFYWSKEDDGEAT